VSAQSAASRRSVHIVVGSNAGPAVTCLSLFINWVPTPFDCFPLNPASLRRLVPSRFNHSPHVMEKLDQVNTRCPTTYQTRLFFNNFIANEDIATTPRRTAGTFLFISHLRMYSCSNFVAISSLILELLKNYRVW
jgi:hypothetical protein